MYNKKVEWVLRVAVFGEFLGHGLLAIGGKADWVKWIGQILGTSPETSLTLLWWVGIIDVLVAIIVLLRPVKVVLLYAAVWGFWTALVRPLVGDMSNFTLLSPWLDFVERFANWGAPLALLLMLGWPHSLREWFKER